MKLLCLLAICAIHCATAADVAFSSLVAQGAVVDFGISVEYRNNDQTEFVPYASCQGNNDCVALNWDDDAELRVTVEFPSTQDLTESFGPVEVAGNTLRNPVQFEIQACFETPFTRNRKWRKPKDVIQDDKRCTKTVVSKRELPDATTSYSYTVKSDMPEARYFLTLFLFCQVPNTNGDEYCGIDTTGPLTALASASNVQDRLGENSGDVNVFLGRLDTSDPFFFRTTVIDSRPTKLVVCVVILSVLSVSMLILYFIYERQLKKTA